MMGLYGIGGKPGSGKTFWAVHHIITRYFEWSKIHHEYVRRIPVEIITNIDELRIDHFNLNEMIELAGGVEKFFTIEYQRHKVMSRFSRVVYIMDEAGQYFGPGFKDSGVFSFLQYHRHLGIDIYLLSAALDTLSKGVLTLLEYRLVAKERSRRLANELRYVKYLGSEKAGISVLKKDSRIFGLYKSMDKEELEKIPSVTRRYALFVGVLIIVGVVLVRCTMWNMVHGHSSVAEVKASVPSPKPPVCRVDPVAIRPGGPLSEAGIKGGTGLKMMMTRKVLNGGAEFCFSDHAKVYISVLPDGEKVALCSDGRMWRGASVRYLLDRAEVVGADLYIDRVARPAGEKAVDSSPPVGSLLAVKKALDKR